MKNRKVNKERVNMIYAELKDRKDKDEKKSEKMIDVRERYEKEFAWDYD